MRILIYSTNFAPEPTGIGKYSGEMATWFSEKGHEVRVVAAPPYYPNWSVAQAYKKWPFYRKEQSGVYQNGRSSSLIVYRCPIWVPKNPSGLTRILHMATFAISSLPVMLKQIVWQPELVITVAPAFMCAPAGLLTAKLSGAGSWLHIQDFEIDVAFEMGFLKGKLVKKLTMGLERIIMSGFDTVSTISHRMIEKLRQKSIVENKIVFLPNWVDINQIEPLAQPLRYRKLLHIGLEQKVVLFSGSLAGKQGLMVIPEVAKILSYRDDIVFLICGDGIMKGELQAASRDLKNVKFLDLQPLENLSELLSTADIHLLTQSPDAQDLVLPSKLSGMLASGRPVIATSHENTEISSVVRNCGFVVPPENAMAISDAIFGLIEEPELMAEFGNAARQYTIDYLSHSRVLSNLDLQIEQRHLGSNKPRKGAKLVSKFVSLATFFMWLIGVVRSRLSF